MNNNIDIELQRIFKDILDNGEIRNQERTGVGTKATFFQTLRFDAREFAPISQLRRIAVKSAIAEAIWILKGRTDLEWLEEHGVKYWKAWADENGKLGKVYGYQMRNFESHNNTVDQLKDLIEGLKKNPQGRRHIISLWNPANLPEMQLPCCHFLQQYYLTNDGYLNQIVNQRSCDFVLGVPHDLVIYKVYLDLIAREIGAKPGIMNYVFADSHIYTNHIPAAEELVSRDVSNLTLPKIVINSDKSIFDIEPEDIQVIDYNPLPFEKEKFDLEVAV